ncbi:MAG: ABC transporter substrate-binding protein [Candidatus Eiseniibacteriota bacterium]
MRPRLAAFLVTALLSATSAAQAADKFTVLLDWFVNPDHGPLYVALEKGYFKDAGLDVELLAPADPNDPPKFVAAGKGDVAVSYQPELHMQVAGGLPVVRIGTLVTTPLNCLAVLADSPIKTLADLKGKKIGYSVAGADEALVSAMLKTVGLGLKDVTMVNVNFSLSPALMAGKVDAVIGAYRNFELNQMALEGRPGRCFYLEEHGVPAFDQLIFIAKSDRVGDPKLRKFIDAVERGALYLVNHPDESWQLFIKGRKDLDTELNKRAWTDTIPRFSYEPAALDRRRYERFAAFLKEHGLIKTVPRLATYAIELP